MNAIEFPDVKIYALVNGLDNSVFYVGATVQKLEARLSFHVNTRLDSTKAQIIYQILCKRGKIEIMELDIVPHNLASFFEGFYIDLYRAYGFKLCQGRGSNYNEVTTKRLMLKALFKGDYHYKDERTGRETYVSTRDCYNGWRKEYLEAKTKSLCR